MSEASLDELLAAFSAEEAAHQVLAGLEARVAAPALAEDMTLDQVLRQFGLEERAARRLALDPGLAGDLEVFASKALARVDPSLRQAFPVVNAFLEGAGAALPGGSLAVHLLLVLAEGPLLSLLEVWLASRAAEVEKAHRELEAE